MEQPTTPRRTTARRTQFQPRFTLAIAYFALLFFAWCFVLAGSALREVAQRVEPGPAQEEAAREAAREALRGRVPLAAGAAIASFGVLSYLRALPGLRAPR